MLNSVYCRISYFLFPYATYPTCIHSYYLPFAYYVLRGNPKTASNKSADSSVHTTQLTTTATIPRARNEITDRMLAEIIGYYKKNYENDSVRMSVSPSDTIVEVSFADTSTDTDAYHGTLFIAYISKVTDINPVVKGDMNGDGAPDILFTVHTEGGGGGGNDWWDDHFLFVATGNQYTLADMKSDGDIMNGSGYFSPKEISNQIINGIGNDYADTDGHCCPSLYYRMQVQLKNGELTTISRTAIPKPADE